MIPLMKPCFSEEMKEAAVYALENEWYVLGESVYKFEVEFAKACNAKEAVAVSSGTDALMLALLALDLKHNQEVITSPASFIASANAVIHGNGTPKFADIDLKSRNIDPHKIQLNITEKTGFLLPVYLYGRPAPMRQILDIAADKKIKIVADAAQAHGAKYIGKDIGGIADATCYSFYSSKCMTVCGDGGMVTTNNSEVAEKVRKLRDCGRLSKYEHDVIGYTSRMNNVNAAIGRVQLKNLEKWNSLRRKKAQAYNKALKGVGDITLPPKDNQEFKSSYYLYAIRTFKRDKLKKHLESQGIQCGIHYPIPIHLQPIYKKTFGYKGGEFPNSELLSKTTLSLPIHPHLLKEEIKFIVNTIYSFFEKA